MEPSSYPQIPPGWARRGRVVDQACRRPHPASIPSQKGERRWPVPSGGGGGRQRAENSSTFKHAAFCECGTGVHGADEGLGRPGLNRFSYIQPSSSPLMLVGFVVLWVFLCFVLLCCPLDLHASPTKRKHTPSLPAAAWGLGTGQIWGSRGALRGTTGAHLPAHAQPSASPTSILSHVLEPPCPPLAPSIPASLGPHGPAPATDSLHHLPATAASAALSVPCARLP